MPTIRSGMYGPLVGAVDQGTSSTRFLVFASKTSEVLTYHQISSKNIYPHEGWVEQDPKEILAAVVTCIEKAVENLNKLEVDPEDIKAIGICNQRETTIIWDKHTGEPLYNAIIWLDNRTQRTVEELLDKLPARNKDHLQGRCGLPLSTYFSALKLKWLIDNIPNASLDIKEGRCLFGTVDSWIIWNLTGGPNGGIHVTDVTNASRTMLMDVVSLEWDPYLCNFFQIPMNILPRICSSSEIYGLVSKGSLNGVPISGCLGDQSAALVGQMCFHPGSTKNTYGTGCFLLCNTGTLPVWSQQGLLTTVAYKLGRNKPAFYALEGSVAVAGAAVQWLRDNMEVFRTMEEVETLASSVCSTHGIYFVPAFSGLYAPYWQSDARGVICGLTQFSTRIHLIRAALEAVCFQTKEIVDAMFRDCGCQLEKLQVDGGMATNNLLMQLQADLLGAPVVRPVMHETTALGAAMAAGAAEGVDVWTIDLLERTDATGCDRFTPNVSEEERERRFSKWKDAVKRSMHWEDLDDAKFRSGPKYLQLASLPGGIFTVSSFCLLLFAQFLSSATRDAGS